jgi:hypothetical protein
MPAIGGAAELGLQLDQVPVARELLLGLEPQLQDSETTAETVPAAEPRAHSSAATPGDRTSTDVAALAKAWLAAAPASPQVLPAAQGQSSGGFWRWIKKHWYVPVLAGLAVGYTVSDDGSDDPNDPED